MQRLSNTGKQKKQNQLTIYHITATKEMMMWQMKKVADLSYNLVTKTDDKADGKINNTVNDY